MGTAIHSTSRGPAVSFRAFIDTGAAAFVAALLTCSPAARADSATDALAPFRTLDRSLAMRVLALDPERLSAADVRDTLSRVPAPHVIALSGSVALVTMQPFAEFLAEMGYPRPRLVNPRDGSLSYSSLPG